ncbi:sulfotransferase family cytosolic 2B member 1-like [Pelobates cultripes]|uniref:Sulfotransferase n=1 Tax=Pelobates cultripes TaxID=61616 RepID=A0AAD1T9Y4_PELCU|nr:sulfotransferase family cytosolic 2B member 1-like [Pelobates cultripes]CAH2319315.1 sulfotransferase family cytosolic 2B member 1-like [Pelobates cultripes]
MMGKENFVHKGTPFAVNVHSEESLNYAENEFPVLDDDIFNVTYPKSGTNWMIEILNLIKYKGDTTMSNRVPIYERSPWYETIFGKEQVKALNHPRIISSHLPYHMFAKSFSKSKAKIIYTMRNPKDVFVSNYHFAHALQIFKEPKSLQEHMDNFLQGNSLYGSWFDHVKGWMQMKEDRRFFYITYEELQQDLRGCVLRICKFLGQELEDEAIDSVVKNSSFKVMKDNKMANWTTIPSDVLDHSKGSFMRKGVCGDWKNYFTVAQNEIFDDVYQEQMKDLNTKLFWDEN